MIFLPVALGCFRPVDRFDSCDGHRDVAPLGARGAWGNVPVPGGVNDAVAEMKHAQGAPLLEEYVHCVQVVPLGHRLSDTLVF